MRARLPRTLHTGMPSGVNSSAPCIMFLRPTANLTRRKWLLMMMMVVEAMTTTDFVFPSGIFSNQGMDVCGCHRPSERKLVAICELGMLIWRAEPVSSGNQQSYLLQSVEGRKRSISLPYNAVINVLFSINYLHVWVFDTNVEYAYACKWKKSHEKYIYIYKKEESWLYFADKHTLLR